jgi:hypothetical protein
MSTTRIAAGGLPPNRPINDDLNDRDEWHRGRITRRCLMLVLTRRPGESVLIGENIEVMIVDVDWMDLETRCAISVCDEDGNDQRLQHAKTPTGVTIVRQK